MTPDQALSFVEGHGVVLASAKGPAPRLTEAIVGQAIKGSWWAHPRGREIFSVFQALAQSPDILVCRLIQGKVTYAHRRVWPALIRLATHFPAKSLAKVDQVHTEAGHHINQEVAFPDWADAASLARATDLSEDEAIAMLGEWASGLARR